VTHIHECFSREDLFSLQRAYSWDLIKSGNLILRTPHECRALAKGKGNDKTISGPNKSECAVDKAISIPIPTRDSTPFARASLRSAKHHNDTLIMKLLKKRISFKDSSGMVLLRPDTAEDLWHAYNLLQVGDLVRCTTIRKVVKESNTGSTSSSKKRMLLTIDVRAVDFDVDVLQVRLSGTVRSENDNVRMGAYHTLTLELNQNFSIEKECWDQILLDRLDEATHPDRQAELAAVVMQPGLAHVCLVTGALTITKARIEVSIPKKRTGSSQHQKSTTKFYEQVYQAVLRHIDFSKVKCVVLGSPGFVKDDFFQYIQQESVRRDDRSIIENKSKFVLCKASSGHKHALEDVFSDPAILAQMTETKVAREVEALNRFMRMMAVDPDKAYYGYNHGRRKYKCFRCRESLCFVAYLVSFFSRQGARAASN
jgi:protein pelota